MNPKITWKPVDPDKNRLYGYINHGVKDERGREVGHQFWIRDTTDTKFQEYFKQKFGNAKFYANANITRDKVPFGACRPDIALKANTLEDAVKEVEAMIYGYHRRTVKNMVKRLERLRDKLTPFEALTGNRRSVK